MVFLYFSLMVCLRKMPKKKNVFPPTNIMGRYLGRKKCYVLIKLVRDSETESLDCEFQNRSFALIPPLLSERKPEESRDCLTVLSTIRSGLENSFSLRDGLSYREQNALSICQFPLVCYIKHEAIFSSLYSENLLGLLQEKFMNLGGFPKTGPIKL